MSYKTLRDGEGISLKSGERFKLACCDCALVHEVVIVAEGKHIGLALKRHKRATAARRRNKAAATSSGGDVGTPVASGNLPNRLASTAGEPRG